MVVRYSWYAGDEKGARIVEQRFALAIAEVDQPILAGRHRP
jgi:hypothetical protein